MKNRIIHILFCILFSLAFSLGASAQFRKEAFTQEYSDEATTSDTTETWFSFKEYFGGLSHKNELKIGTNFGAATIFIGGQQIYEKKYWKLPIIYGGLGTTIGLGFHYKNTGKTDLSTLMFAGAGLIYWGTLMDGAASFNKGVYPQPGKATIYSILCPGLGQIYNKEYWKVPIYWGCLLGAGHFWDFNSTNYNRFRRMYIEANDPEKKDLVPIDAETAKYYRDIYRRYRDYSILAFAAFYLLQVIDANVFSYMQDFEVTDDISMNISPTVLTTDNQFAMQPAGIGLSLGLRF